MSPGPIEPAGLQPRVLIVDDHPLMRRLLHLALGDEFPAVEASNVPVALQQLAQWRPEVVLLDVMLDGPRDGLQLIEAIRASADAATMWIAMVSAKGQMSDIQEAMQRGADAYFVKPASPTALRNWVKKALETRRTA